MAKTTRNVDELAGILLHSFRGSQQAASLSGKMQNTYATVIDVEDPEELGRVRVILDQTNPDFLIGKGFEQEGEPSETDWIYPIVPFVGLQPQALVDNMARVPIVPRDGDPNRLNFGDPVYDPNEFEEAQQPLNSAMTRLPVYPSGELPPPIEENIGCMVIEEDGPCDSDWLCVCLKRRGAYYWVRHIDLNHIHADQDDGIQPSDSAGDGEAPVDEGPIWDLVAPTTDSAYSQQSYDPKDAGYFGGA
jgi:hypothetical protein